MRQLSNNLRVEYLMGACLPITLLIAQVYSIYLGIILLVAFGLLAFFHKNTKKISILICILLAGYLFWQSTYNYLPILLVNNPASQSLIPILSRFGLIGYLLLFSVWYCYDKTNEHFFKIGNLSANIKIPLIWQGFNDSVLRVSGVFSLACLVIASIFIINKQMHLDLICLGIIFSLVNSILEELLWRGFVFNRLIDLYHEKIALIIMSLTFGFYHYSLGFTLPICLLFALGGIYFGGVTIKSRGLLASISMHFAMNMLFVSMGIIF